MGACYLRGWAAEKVKGGKLLRARVEHDGAKFTSVRLTGDFYLHPEEGLPHLEGALVGASVSEPEDRLAARVQRAAEERGLELLGLTPESVARVVFEAVRASEEVSE